MEPLSADQLAGSAYPSEWTIAQVLSHLGSGAEIFSLLLEAGTTGAGPPGMDTFREVWAVWDAKFPVDQARDGIAADHELLVRAGGLTADEQERFSLEMFGEQQDLSGLLSLRAGEQVVHAWDVLVTLDPTTTLEPAAVGLLLGQLSRLALRGKPVDTEQLIALTTEDPSHHVLLSIGHDGPTISEVGEGDIKATLRLPAEALIRLIYGRLDPAHTPPVQTEGVDLNLLRAAFPGF